jgi:hypothetical protein
MKPPRKDPVPTTNAKQKAFLAAYAATASITAAARAARIDRTSHYLWLQDSKGYPEAFAAAGEQAAQTLEDEAVRRANEGVFEPNVFKGQFTYGPEAFTKDAEGRTTLKRGAKPLGIWKYSDTLLQFLLKGLRPEKYRDTWKGEISIPDGVKISPDAAALATLTDEQLDHLAEIAAKLRPTVLSGNPGRTKPARKK